MGNCIAQGPHLHWGGEDWGPDLALPEPGHDPAQRPRCHPACTEVKVKITRKQLEELVKKLDAQAGLTVQQVLAQFVKAGSRCHTTANWRPRLQPIPELTFSDSSGSEVN